MPYCKNVQILICPSDPTRSNCGRTNWGANYWPGANSYAFNISTHTTAAGSVPEPARTVLLGDSQKSLGYFGLCHNASSPDPGYYPTYTGSQCPWIRVLYGARHMGQAGTYQGGNNITFWDGHAKYYTIERLKRRQGVIWMPGYGW
jgi:prepilin-type processing-associated H-X9-DG protein